MTAQSISTVGDISVTGTVDGVDVAGLNTALTSGTKSDSRIANILDKVYPIGSIYMSLTQSTTPANLFGGVWIAVGAGRVLMGHGQGTDKNGDTYSGVVGATDNVGEYKHTLTNGEMPRHDHVPNRNSQDSFNRLVMDKSNNTNTGSGFDTTPNEIALNNGVIIQEEGNDLPHNNQQPHLVVYMWQRDS
jgi:microcystin-dependent protein